MQDPLGVVFVLCLTNPTRDTQQMQLQSLLYVIYIYMCVCDSHDDWRRDASLLRH